MDDFNKPVIQNQSAKTNWRQFGRHWMIVFILAILAGFVIWSLLKARPLLKGLENQLLSWRNQKQNQKDLYGGKTPQETYNLFINALEKGNIDLASKYFVIEKQSQWKKTLNDYKNQNVTEQFIKELKSSYSKVNFQRNTISNVWKIVDL